MADYDLGEAFKSIEEELIASMIRNLDHHRAEETDEGIQWSQWQVEQLRALEEYRRENREKFNPRFRDINSQIPDLIDMARQQGGMDQEIAIMEAMKNGLQTRKASDAVMGEFFTVNDRKLNALVNATQNDFSKAEHAVLRMADDKYRKAIFNAQVYANAGGTTYEKAVDMATRDMLRAGLNCVEYKNGARHTLSDYADMCLKTATKRAYLTGEGEKRKEWGIATVIMNKRGNPCPLCAPWCGKVLIDDVWSGGKPDGKHPLMSAAIEKGLYHPRCKDVHTTYFPGISTADDPYDRKEQEELVEDYNQEQKQSYYERQAEQCERIGKYSLDPDNKKMYQERAEQWKNVRFKTAGRTSREYAESKRPLANFRALSKDLVVNTLRKESERWIKSLTEREKHAISKYTYNSGDKKPNRFFERLNAMLRGDAAEDGKLREYADIISKAIKKNELQHDVIVYRGMDIDPTAGVKKGGIYQSKQFFSTSVMEGGALKGDYRLIIYVKKGSNAAYIENISYFKKQRELLLDKDCIYRVISRKDNIIELEVI